uniref:Neurocan n=1 Tax=Oncorhynchus mykiss TaxID=8022 RepID=A0A8C7QH54_ONCMY
FFLSLGVSEAASIVNMRRVIHPTVQEPLAGFAHLPCVFTHKPSEPSPSSQPPHIQWTRTWVLRGGMGDPLEQMVLSAKGDVVKVNKAFAGRVRLLGYAANNLNATMEISGLRSNDTGTYHCQVVVGDNYERDVLPLVVMGVVFHYRSPSDRYALSFDDAQWVCQENSALIATPTQLWAVFYNGYANCAAGWLSDQTVRYPIQSPERGCYGQQEYSAGVRNYGKRDPNELFDVYCFAGELDGEVFHSWVPGRLTLPSASERCISLGGQLATVGQLYLAWKAGLDSCAPGWLSDGSVRYPITQPRQGCGGDQPGVWTVVPNTSETTTSRLGELDDIPPTGEPSSSPARLTSTPASESQSSASSSTPGGREAVPDTTQPKGGTLVHVAPSKVEISPQPDYIPTRADGLASVGRERVMVKEEGSAEGASEEAGGKIQFTRLPVGTRKPIIRVPPSNERTTRKDQSGASRSTTQPPVSSSPAGSDSRDSFPPSRPGTGALAPPPSASVIQGSSKEASWSLSWVSVERSAEQGGEGPESGPLALPSGPPVEEDTAWSHALGSGLPSNLGEEGGRSAGFNRSNRTLVDGYSRTLQPVLCVFFLTDVDDCQSSPCLNGGTCIDKIHSFVCLCLPSYAGDTCEKGKTVNTHWYFSHRHTWEDAEKDCRVHSAHLSSITSVTEQEFINGLGHDNAWIGLNDRTHDYSIIENYYNVTYLCESQPDNFFAGGEDCVVTIAHEDGKWNDVPCNYNLPYVCKKGTVLCGTPPAVENAHLIGRRRSHYDIHAVVRYQCTEGFYQRHIPTARCRANGIWDRPKIICTKMVNVVTAPSVFPSVSSTIPPVPPQPPPRPAPGAQEPQETWRRGTQGEGR